MTKKDYIVIAQALKETQGYRHMNKYLYGATCNNLAEHMKADNPRFDRMAFFKACGISDNLAESL